MPSRHSESNSSVTAGQAAPSQRQIKQLVHPLEHYGKTRPTRVRVGRTRDSPAIFHTAIVLLF